MGISGRLVAIVICRSIQWPSVAISGHQWPSVAVSGHQWPSVVDFSTSSNAIQSAAAVQNSSLDETRREKGLVHVEHSSARSAAAGGGSYLHRITVDADPRVTRAHKGNVVAEEARVHHVVMDQHAK